MSLKIYETKQGFHLLLKMETLHFKGIVDPKHFLVIYSTSGSSYKSLCPAKQKGRYLEECK